MDESVAESVKQVLGERIKNPLWGFITLAWLWFNWPNLAMLFMSDAPVKFRIDYILSQHDFYLHYVIAPILAGALLAVVSPYAQWLLSGAHKWVDQRRRMNLVQQKKAQLDETIALAEKQVAADRAVETGNAKIDAELQIEVEKVKQAQLKTEDLEQARSKLAGQIEELTRKCNDLQNYKEKLADDIATNYADIARLLNLASNAINSRTFEQLHEFTLRANQIVGADALEKATLMNKVAAEEKLTLKEIERYLELLGEKMSSRERAEFRNNFSQ